MARSAGEGRKQGRGEANEFEQIGIAGPLTFETPVPVMPSGGETLDRIPQREHAPETDYDRQLRATYEAEADRLGMEERVRQVLAQDLSGQYTAMFDEILAALNPRERILFINTLYRFEKVEEIYVMSMVSAFYEALRSSNVERIYASMLDSMSSMWGHDAIREFIDTVMNEQPDNVSEYSVTEKILMLLGFQYAYLEAFGIKPESPPLWEQLLRTGVTQFTRTSTYTAEQGLMTEQMRAYMEVANAIDSSGGTEEQSAGAIANRLLLTPMMFGALNASMGMLTVLGDYFITWLSEQFSDRHQTIVEILDSMGRRIVNNPFMMMECFSSIATVGDKWEDEDSRQIVNDAVGIINDGIDEHYLNPWGNPLQVALMYRLLAITVGPAMQDPNESSEWYCTNATCRGFIEHVIEDGISGGGPLATNDDLMKFIDTIESIARQGGQTYNLHDIAIAIFEVSGEMGLDTALERAYALAYEPTHPRVITADSLRLSDPRRAEWF